MSHDLKMANNVQQCSRTISKLLMPRGYRSKPVSVPALCCTRSITMRPVSTTSHDTSRKNHINVSDFKIRKAESNTDSKSNTLVVLFGFYRASESAIKRYCDVYHKYGIDVVFVKSVLKHFSWPKNSVILAESLLKFLSQDCSEYDKFLVHAFSMGAYNFTVCFGTMYDHPDLYLQTQKKIYGVIYDSLTIGSLENMSQGVATGMSKNTVVRKVIIGLTQLYFSATFQNTVVFYDRYIKIFKEQPLQVPTLFYYSRNDPMSDADVVDAIIEDWRAKFTFPLSAKSWDRSKHAAHLLTHNEEYLQVLDTFINSSLQKDKEVKSKL